MIFLARVDPGDQWVCLGRFAGFIPAAAEIGMIFFADIVAMLRFHEAQIAPNRAHEQEKSSVTEEGVPGSPPRPTIQSFTRA
jgi:hypothetical protein